MLTITTGFARAESIDDVLDRMDVVEADLRPEDGVAVFNWMYREVTKLVDKAVDAKQLRAGDFMSRLDVHFANLFFAAYAADAAGESVPRAWAPLFEHRTRPQTQPIQLALAGMNAHISHDLPYAVVDTCREAGLNPDNDTPQHHDYTATSQVLEAASMEIHSWFDTGIVANLDDMGGKVDDAFAMWSIDAARGAAWLWAQTLWGLADSPQLLALFGDGHRRGVEMTSRAILL